MTNRRKRGDQRVIRLVDAPDYLGIGRTAFHENLVRSGKVRPFSILPNGRAMVVPVEELDAVIEERKRAARGDDNAA